MTKSIVIAAVIAIIAAVFIIGKYLLFNLTHKLAPSSSPTGISPPSPQRIAPPSPPSIAPLPTPVIPPQENEHWYSGSTKPAYKVVSDFPDQCNYLEKSASESSFVSGSALKCNYNPKAKIAIINSLEGEVLRTPGDWLVIMKPGYTPSCVKCCMKEAHPKSPMATCSADLSGPVVESFRSACNFHGSDYYFGYLSSKMAADMAAKGLPATAGSLKWTGKSPLSDIGLCDPSSPLMETLMNCSEQTGYIAWNDQNYAKPATGHSGAPVKGGSCNSLWQRENFTMPTGKCPWPGHPICENVDAHDKGFIVFDEQGAVLCTHSCPGFPMATGGNSPCCFSSFFMSNIINDQVSGSGGNATKSGQSFVFSYMNAAQMDSYMPRVWALMQSNFADAYMPPNLYDIYPSTKGIIVSVFKQVPMDPSKIECVQPSTCKAANPSARGKHTLKKKTPWLKADLTKRMDACEGVTAECPTAKGEACGYSFPKKDESDGQRYGSDACRVGMLGCKGQSQSFTEWDNLKGSPALQSLMKAAGPLGGSPLVQTFPVVKNELVLLSKSGYYMGGNADIWAEVIGPVIKSSMVGTSWDDQHGGNVIYKSPTSGYSGADYSAFNPTGAHAGRAKIIGCSTSKAPFNSDHSKMGIAVEPNNFWCAIGGLNRFANGLANKGLYPKVGLFPDSGTDLCCLAKPKPCASCAACSQCCRGTMYLLINNEYLHNALKQWLQITSADLSKMYHK